MFIDDRIIAKLTVDYFGKEDIPVSLNNQLREKYKSFPDYGRETDQMLLESKCRSDVEEYIKKKFSGNQRPIVQTLLSTIRDKEAKLYWTDSTDRDYEQRLKMDIYTMEEFIDWMHIKASTPASRFITRKSTRMMDSRWRSSRNSTRITRIGNHDQSAGKRWQADLIF